MEKKEEELIKEIVKLEKEMERRGMKSDLKGRLIAYKLGLDIILGNK